MVGAQKQAALEKIRKMANDDFDSGKFSNEIFEQELNRMDILQEDIKIYLKKKARPFGNIEDIEPEDAKVIEEWIAEIQEVGISDLDKDGIEVGL